MTPRKTPKQRPCDFCGSNSNLVTKLMQSAKGNKESFSERRFKFASGHAMFFLCAECIKTMQDLEKACDKIKKKKDDDERGFLPV